MTYGPVLIVEDHELLAQTLGIALAAEGLETVVADVGLGVDGSALIAHATAVGAAVVLLDLDLGAGRTGEALLPGLRSTGAAVVVVTGCGDPIRLGTCIELGAAAVLSKSRPLDEMLAAVLAAREGRPAMSEARRQELLARMRRERGRQGERFAPFERLTPREAEVLAQLIEGEPAEAIARHFVVSEATVRTQIRGVLTKLGVNSQLAAVAEAHRVGWTRPQRESA